MKTVNGILALIQEYAVDYHDGYYAKATANRLVKLRTAIEELHRDAARYREIRKGNALTVKMKKTVGIYAAQSDKDYPEALDAAIDAAMEST